MSPLYSTLCYERKQTNSIAPDPEVDYFDPGGQLTERAPRPRAAPPSVSLMEEQSTSVCLGALLGAWEAVRAEERRASDRRAPTDPGCVLRSSISDLEGGQQCGLRHGSPLCRLFPPVSSDPWIWSCGICLFFIFLIAQSWVKRWQKVIILFYICPTSIVLTSVV